MVEMICSQVDRREEFKRNVIVFVVSSCINGNQRGEVNYLLCYLDRVVFKVWTANYQFPTLRGWTNDKVKSREEQEFEVGFGKEEPSNVTPEAIAEAEHDTVRSKIKALLEDAKKASNEIITNTRVLARVIMELEKLVPEAHVSLKRNNSCADQTDALFAETTLPGKSKSTKPVLSPDPYESEDFLLAVEAIEKQFLTAQKSEHHFPQFTPPSFSLGLSQEENEPTTTHIFIREAEHKEESVAPVTGVVIRELDIDVPLRDVQEASHVGKGKAIMEEVSRRPRARSMQCSTIQNCDQRARCERSIVRCTRSKLCWQRQRHYGGSVNETNNEVHVIHQLASANSFVARVIVVDHYSSFSSKQCLKDRQVLALRRRMGEETE
ncbi:LOW QUALITY PROTEIN: hypothetical protein Cgig2_003908 [Carnegiea gigantea]|uniref:Uncharacterized protein n=1 Tax=Carnegiea gigantea TaxID=171969 RepID=A0A9Q1GWQ7_9CARY|nr:LOW QUALITY PROTEIN: hypothetical protein Cgig2_003908 [Carnegiea gigantea]